MLFCGGRDEQKQNLISGKKKWAIKWHKVIIEQNYTIHAV